MGGQAETAAKGRKEDHLAGNRVSAGGVQVQVTSGEALGIKKKIFPAKDAVAEEAVAEEAVAEEAVAEEAVAEEAVAEEAVAEEAVAEDAVAKEVSREMGAED